VDIYDEACREIRLALDAYAVAVVDLSQFHMFYPAYQSSSTAATSTRGGSASNSQSMQTGSSVKSRGPASTSDSAIADEADAYSKSTNVKRARKTWAITDPTAPSRTPQVLFIPGARKSDPKQSKYSKAPEGIAGQHDVGPDCFLLFCHLVDFSKQLAVLGYSCAYDGFAFNFTSSPAARKIISDFIASNVKVRMRLLKCRANVDRHVEYGIPETIARGLRKVSHILCHPGQRRAWRCLFLASMDRWVLHR